MKLSLVLAPVAATLLAGTSFASVLDVTYTGTVSSALGTTANSGYTDGQVITGQFFIDTTTDVVSGSSLGVFAAPATAGTASLSASDAIFTQAQYASAGAATNQSISVDLSALSSFTGTDPGAFLSQDPATLASLIDFTGAASAFPSTVMYYQGNADGTGITAVDAFLTNLTVTAVPLPAPVWLMLSGLAGLAVVARRRQPAA